MRLSSSLMGVLLAVVLSTGCTSSDKSGSTQPTTSTPDVGAVASETEVLNPTALPVEPPVLPPGEFENPPVTLSSFAEEAEGLGASIEVPEGERELLTGGDLEPYETTRSDLEFVLNFRAVCLWLDGWVDGQIPFETATAQIDTILAGPGFEDSQNIGEGITAMLDNVAQGDESTLDEFMAANCARMQLDLK